MATTDRLYQDFISFVIDADPGSAGVTLSAPGLTDLLVVADPDFIALTLDPREVFGAPEIVWVSAHTGSATTATIVRAQEGTTARAHDVGTVGIASLTSVALADIAEVRGSVEVAGAVSVTSPYATMATVSLDIPTAWGSWDCEAYATLVREMLDGGEPTTQFATLIRIDGTDQQQHAEHGITTVDLTTNLPELRGGAVGGHRTGMTTTGSRDILLRAKQSTGGSVDMFDIYLYARAIRTS